MTDPRIAALAEALRSTAGGDWQTFPEQAAAILAALPPGWCGHDDGDLTTAYMVGYEKGKDATAAEFARFLDAATSLDDLRAALEEDR